VNPEKLISNESSKYGSDTFDPGSKEKIDQEEDEIVTI